MLATCSQSYHWWVVTVLNYSYSIFTADFVSLLGHRGLMAYRSNKQLAQVLFNSQRQKISIFLWTSRVILQKKKKVLQTVKMAKCIYHFLQEFSFNYRIFFPPSFPWTFDSFGIINVYTLISEKRVRPPWQVTYYHTALLGRSHMLSTSCACC